MTDVRFRVVNHKYGPRIEMCKRLSNGRFQTASISWRSKPETIKEEDLHFSFESAKDQWEKALGNREHE